MPERILVLGPENFVSSQNKIIAVRGNLLTALLPSKVSFHHKPVRLHFDGLRLYRLTEGKNRGQSPRTEHSVPPSPAPAWKAVPQRLMVLPSRQQGASYTLTPRASPPVSKSKALQAFLPIMAFPSPKQSHLALSADIIEGADNDEKLLPDSNKK